MSVFNVDEYIKENGKSNLTLGAALASVDYGEIQKCLKDWQNSIKPLLENFDQVHESWKNAFQEHFAQFKDILETYRSASAKYEANAKAWGEFGWSIFPNMPMGYLYYTPKSDLAATRVANMYFKDYPISELISDIKSFDNSKNSIFNEAVWLYKNKKYMACALIMFGLIESPIILKQPIQKGRRRKTGSCGFKIVCKDDLNKKDAILFLTQNVLSCFETFFKDGNDFQIKSNVLNRNLLHHGMLKRKVTEKDCRQLMLFYYNLRMCLH